MTEDELLQAITEAATYLGWRWHHIRRSDRAQQMGHSGFPDLIMVRGTDLLAIELKADKGTVTIDQQIWLDQLRTARAVAMVVRPADLDAALKWLK